MSSPAEAVSVPDETGEGEHDDGGSAASGGTDAAGGPEVRAAGDESLRRQQLVVGTAIASLTGMAVVVAGLQQFPDVTPILPFGVGMATTAATFAVVYASIFGR